MVQGMELRGQCRMNKAAWGRERRRLKEIQQEEQGEQRRGERAAFRGYDRVLVDAECTHDGSLRHMAKVRHGGTLATTCERVTNIALSEQEARLGLILICKSNGHVCCLVGVCCGGGQVMELAPERLQKGFLNADKLATLTELQKGLIRWAA